VSAREFLQQNDSDQEIAHPTMSMGVAAVGETSSDEGGVLSDAEHGDPPGVHPDGGLAGSGSAHLQPAW
jgi:hypothetical protein